MENFEKNCRTNHKGYIYMIPTMWYSGKGRSMEMVKRFFKKHKNSVCHLLKCCKVKSTANLEFCSHQKYPLKMRANTKQKNERIYYQLIYTKVNTKWYSLGRMKIILIRSPEMQTAIKSNVQDRHLGKSKSTLV